MRPLPLLLIVAVGALLLAGCGGVVDEATTTGGDPVDGSGVDASTAPSIRIEIEGADSPAGPDAVDPLVLTDSATAASSRSPSPTSPTGPSSAPQSSVVAQAVVPSVVARVAPADDATVVATLDHPTAVGSPLVFLAVDGQAAPAGWLEVRLPVQPNGTTGWVRRNEVTLFENPYRIEIDRAAHRLEVLHRGQLWMETTIAVGTGATPTPVGEFYLLELLAPPDPTGPYGPYAFGLSGFSEVLDSFGGADSAIIGLHGTDDPGALGSDVSFGCIRLANDVIEQLATTLPLGTPVTIT